MNNDFVTCWILDRFLSSSPLPPHLIWQTLSLFTSSNAMSRKRDKPYFSRHAPYPGSKRRRPLPPHPEPEPELDKPTYKQTTVPPSLLKPPSLLLSTHQLVSPSNPKNCRCFRRRTHLLNGGRESELVLKIEIPVPGRRKFDHRCHQFTQTSSLSFVICRLLQLHRPGPNATAGSRRFPKSSSLRHAR